MSVHNYGYPLPNGCAIFILLYIHMYNYTHISTCTYMGVVKGVVTTTPLIHKGSKVERQIMVIFLWGPKFRKSLQKGEKCVCVCVCGEGTGSEEVCVAGRGRGVVMGGANSLQHVLDNSLLRKSGHHYHLSCSFRPGRCWACCLRGVGTVRTGLLVE